MIRISKLAWTSVQTLALAVLLTAFASPPVQADEQEEIAKINQLIQEGEMDKAEERYQAALGEYPDSARLKNLARGFYTGYARAGNYKKAGDYYSEMAMQAVASPNTPTATLGGFASTLVSIYGRSEKPAVAIEKIKELIAAVEANDGGRSKDDVEVALAQLRSGLAVGLARADQINEANEIQSVQLEVAEKRFLENQDDVTAILLYATWLRGNTSIKMAAADSEGAEEATKAHRTFIVEQTMKNPTVAPLLQEYSTAKMSEIGGLVYTDPNQAKQVLGDTIKFLDGIETDDRVITNIVDSTKTRLETYQPRIASALEREALIGQRRPPLEFQTFANGEPITDEDLDGKVVLIDFWAVWCGPCIATFPHLREWQEEYADKGLVIIGATKYSQYDWDDSVNRISKNEDLSEEAERAAMERFAKFHELEHTFGVSEDGAIHKQYLVSGIPQAVLIDRNGIIRMIRVGSGEANAKALGDLLEELIAEGQ